MEVIYHPAASRELRASILFYENRVPGLGEQLLNEVEASVGLIGEHPERFTVVSGAVRRMLLPRFPFGIYFRNQGKVLRVLAVYHHSRNPKVLRERFHEA